MRAVCLALALAACARDVPPLPVAPPAYDYDLTLFIGTDPEEQADDDAAPDYLSAVLPPIRGEHD